MPPELPAHRGVVYLYDETKQFNIFECHSTVIKIGNAVGRNAMMFQSCKTFDKEIKAEHFPKKDIKVYEVIIFSLTDKTLLRRMNAIVYYALQQYPTLEVLLIKTGMKYKDSKYGWNKNLKAFIKL